MLVARAVVVVHVKVRDDITERRDQLGGVLVDRSVPGVEADPSVRAERMDDGREVRGGLIDPGVEGPAVLDRDRDAELCGALHDFP